jgi:Tol biopolymer transport system component/DNA-binding winged helix-turn-helix (wHTH) protein
MGQPAPARAKYRFGSFELDREAAELRKRGVRIKLQDQPYRILCLLLASSGEVVTRETLCAALWPEDTFVEFERSLNAAIAKLRQTLGDSAENPRFIETVARRGYRFIAPLHGIDPAVVTSLHNISAPSVATGATQPGQRNRRPLWLALPVVSGVAAVMALTVAILFFRTTSQRGSAAYTVMRRITSSGGLTKDPAISSDGNLLVYASDRDGNGHLNIWLQQLTGGSTIRLTATDADDHEPSFSPDGTQVVFRSERDGGGIYVVPSFGGETRLIAKNGRDPTFSPDGKWIAYWVGNLTYDVLNVGDVFVIPSSGGVPQMLKTDLRLTYPIWSPDGQHLLVTGVRSNSEGFDWWVFARDGHSGVQTGGFRLLHDQGFPVLDDGGGYPPRAAQWVGDDILFSAGPGDTVNVWTLHLSPNLWHCQGPPRRLASGRDFEDHPHLLPGGRVVFAGLARSASLWSLAIDANEGRPRSDALKRLTDKVSLEQFGSITGDGRYLVFTSSQSGTAHVWLKDLSTGQEKRLNGTDEDEAHPEISSDGTMIAYWHDTGVSVVPRAAPGVPASLCEKCGWVWDWAPDNRTFLYNDLRPIWGIASFDPKSKKKSLVLAGTRGHLYQARYSPDGRWLVFGEQVNGSTSRLFITPMHNGTAGPESEWIPIADENGWCDKPRWSPDGNLVYFISHRDGYRCLWAQHVAPLTRRPLGQPFSVAHFHSARLSMMNIGTGLLEIDVAAHKVIFNLGELTGNIWLASDK